MQVSKDDDQGKKKEWTFCPWCYNNPPANQVAWTRVPNLGID